MQIFEILFYQPIFNILIVLYRLFSENLGLALIGIALLSRLVTIPITNRQIKSAETQREFKEKYDALKAKHKGNKEAFTQEAAKLQAEYLPGQLGGCLPLIFQFIMFINIYNVLRNMLDRGGEAFNEVAYSFIDKFPEGAAINKDFLNVINLGDSPAALGGFKNIGETWPYFILIILVIIAQFFSTKMLSGMQAKKKAQEKSKKPVKKNSEEPDFSEIMQSTSKQMIYILPLMIGFFSYNAPAGLTIYWTVQSGFVIIQRLITKREDVSKWLSNRGILKKPFVSEVKTSKKTIIEGQEVVSQNKESNKSKKKDSPKSGK
ncbi:MAG TPA: YidC/Oxa1 family membrane protein insertase, partial [Candidatus Dojkabacteria bacterium]